MRRPASLIRDERNLRDDSSPHHKCECHTAGTPKRHTSAMGHRWTEADGSVRIGTHEPLVLQWRHGDATVDFRNLALVDPTMGQGGIYVIHRAGHAHRLGQATRVRDRLRAHQQDPRVVRCMDASLSVTWALVPRAYRDGVEAYLGRVLRPEVAERFPAVSPIPVNLPAVMVQPDDLVHQMERVLVVAEREPSAAASSSLERTNSKTGRSGTEPTEAEGLAQALAAHASLHAEDAKNTHWVGECAMCSIFADSERPIAVAARMVRSVP